MNRDKIKEKKSNSFPYIIILFPSLLTMLFFSLNYDYNYFIKFNISIDNIFDIHYRTYSSGISAPGRNINLGLNFKF